MKPRAPAAFGGAQVALRDGIVLVAPGGVFLPNERTLIVADVHSGYTVTLRSRGYAVPPVEDHELRLRVKTLLERTSAEHLVIAGDLVHGAAALDETHEGNPSPLYSFLEIAQEARLRSVLVVPGNHDLRVRPAFEAMGVKVCDEGVTLGPHRVLHGDDPEKTALAREQAIAEGGRVLVGHHHPALVLDDGVGARKKVPAFVTARGVLCLPALSPFSSGGDVRLSPLREELEALAQGAPMGVAVIVGDRVLPIGDVFSVR